MNLTILDFLHSLESVFLFFFVSCYVCIRDALFLLTCILFIFTADVNWLPGSPSPYGYPRQLVL